MDRCLNAPTGATRHSLSLHDALPIFGRPDLAGLAEDWVGDLRETLYSRYKELSDDLIVLPAHYSFARSEEHTSELQSRGHLVCRLLLEKNKTEHVLSSCLQRSDLDST